MRPALLSSVLEVFGLWFFWARIQSGVANCESESNPDRVPTRFKQSDSCLSPGKYKSSKQPITFFQWKQNPNPNWIRLQGRKPHSWSCWKQPESRFKKSKIQSMHTSVLCSPPKVHVFHLETQFSSPPGPPALQLVLSLRSRPDFFKFVEMSFSVSVESCDVLRFVDLIRVARFWFVVYGQTSEKNGQNCCFLKKLWPKSQYVLTMAISIFRGVSNWSKGSIFFADKMWFCLRSKFLP